MKILYTILILIISFSAYPQDFDYDDEEAEEEEDNFFAKGDRAGGGGGGGLNDCAPFSECWCEIHPNNPACGGDEEEEEEQEAPIDNFIYAGLCFGICAGYYYKKRKQSESAIEADKNLKS